jgi:hypothetical protein
MGSGLIPAGGVPVLYRNMRLAIAVHRIDPRSVTVSKTDSPDILFEVPRFATKWMTPPAPGMMVTAAVPEGPPVPHPRKAVPQPAPAQAAPMKPPSKPLPKLLAPLSKKAKAAARRVHAEAFRDRVLAAGHIRDATLKDDIEKLSWRHWETIRRAAIGAMDQADIEIQLMTARCVLEMLVSRKTLTANKMRNVAAAYLRKMDVPPASLMPAEEHAHEQ